MSTSRSATLCIVVCFHNMRREAPRTLQTLVVDYQRGISGLDYEIIAVDNGSSEPLDREATQQLAAGRCTYHYHDTASASPAEAINAAVGRSTADWIMCLIDGARMLSPGIIRYGMLSARAFPEPFAYTLSMHLGPQVQNESMLQGYDQAVEDDLLASIQWQRNGYSLFEVSTLALSSRRGFFAEPSETNCFLMRRERYLRLGGLDEQFREPGGGLVNLDFFNRVHEEPDITPVMLLGEATFHQFHGGVATNVPLAEHPAERFAEEYRRIRGRAFRSSSRPPAYVGEIPPEVRHLIRASALECET